MAVKKSGQFDFDKKDFDWAKKLHFGIAKATWNNEITDKLFDGAMEVFNHIGIPKKNIISVEVPGSFELPLVAQNLVVKKKIAAVLCLGCVIKGDTPHFDYVCKATVDGILRVSLDFNKPVIFGVITANNLQQAKDRAGGKHGNKGEEAAVTAIQMAEIKRNLATN